jgi:hypothetical protein
MTNIPNIYGKNNNSSFTPLFALLQTNQNSSVSLTKFLLFWKKEEGKAIIPTNISPERLLVK